MKEAECPYTISLKLSLNYQVKDNLTNIGFAGDPTWQTCAANSCPAVSHRNVPGGRPADVVPMARAA